MGTRSLTFVMDDYSWNPILCLYRQFDGYPEDHGQDLVNFLKDFIIVNDLRMTQPDQKIANGMGCLAAQLVAHFKTDPGEFYLYPTDTKDVGQDYEYVIGFRDKILQLKIIRVYDKKVLYDGPLKTCDIDSLQEDEE